MNTSMLNIWNDTIKPDDEIYYLGDFTYKANEKSARYILRKLNGKKYFIKGNHDRIEYLNNFQKLRLIEWWKYEYQFQYEHNDKIYNFSLSHYPHYPLPGEDIIYLHGHKHGISEHRGEYQFNPNAIDVGVDNVGFEPITITQVIDYIERQKK